MLTWDRLDFFFFFLCIEIWPGALLDKLLENVRRFLLFWGCTFLGLHPKGVANGHHCHFASLPSQVGVSYCCMLRRIGRKSVLIFHFLLIDGNAVGKQLISQAPGAPQDYKLHPIKVVLTANWPNMTVDRGRWREGRGRECTCLSVWNWGALSLFSLLNYFFIWRTQRERPLLAARRQKTNPLKFLICL